MLAARPRPTWALAAACALSLTLAGAAAAAGPKPLAPASPAGPHVPAKALPAPALGAAAATQLKGYTVAHSAALLAPTGRQSFGEVHCPQGLVPLGGGVFVESNSTAANINSSYPTLTGWGGYVNNASGADTFFDVEVACARRPTHYKVVRHAQTNPAFSHTEVFAQCPAGSKPLGGGGYSTSLTTVVNLNSTYASGQGWRAAEHNAGPSDSVLQTYAVCGQVKGYFVAVGPEVGTPTGQTRIAVACPAPKVPVGGGALSLTGNLAVNLNSTVPSGGEWETFVNSATTTFETAIPVVVCAGAVA